MKRPMVCQPALLKCLIGLAAGVWLASANGQPTYTPIILDHPTPQAFAEFGRAVAGAGDLNGDGLPDLLVGARNQDVGGNVNQGRAFVFSGADRSLLLTLDNPTADARAFFGWAVTGAGDVNGDGIPDLLVGARMQDVGGNPSQGQAFVFSGADGSLLLTLNNPTPQPFAIFGNAVAGAGDVSGDGIPDLLVGAPAQNVAGNSFQGRAFVLSGADGSLLLILDHPTPQAEANFGNAVAGAEDVSGDGIPDLLVGAPGQDVGGDDRQGRAFVLSGADGSLLLILDNPTPQDSGIFEAANFGEAVTGAGDVSGDGVPDLLVGAPLQDIGGNLSQGQTFVFSGANGSLLLTLDNPTPQSGANFGIAVAGAGDVNGDGIPDLLAGAPNQDVGGNFDVGQVFVFSGADGSRLLTLNNPAPQDRASFGGSPTGGSAVAVGDVNVDGIPDLLVGAFGQDVAGNVDQGQAVLFVSSIEMIHIEVTMDILPAAINPDSRGVIPVAILTTPDFDATGVDPLSVRFGPGGATEAHERGHQEDVDGDGDTDLMLHFRTAATGIECGDTEASLTGETLSGEPIRGSDTFKTVGCR